MPQPLDHQLTGLYGQPSDLSAPQEALPDLATFPLTHTVVQATITGNVSRVEVSQTFENPFTVPMEATYVFPLPDEAAVDQMLIRVGDRSIQGCIKRRTEAQQLYEQAKQQGQIAALLEQERDNIFTQSLAHIQPGEPITVTIEYTESLRFRQGNYEFIFPLVVGPRYIPGIPLNETEDGHGSAPTPMTLNLDTYLVPDASRLNPPILPSGVRSGREVQITVSIHAGVRIEAIESPSHAIQEQRQDHKAWVTLTNQDTIPNKDFILRYQVVDQETQTTVLSHRDERGGYLGVYLIPALAYPIEQVVPKEVLFLIDISGSQQGNPLEKCKDLMYCLIRALNPQDTFSIVAFADTTKALSPLPLENTPNNQRAALSFVYDLSAGGGTMMLKGIQSALHHPITDPHRLRSIILLSDGYIGNENQILAEVQRYLKPGTRLHSFGAGSSVNRFLLNRIAEIGRGVCHIIHPHEALDTTVRLFVNQINNPVLTDIQLHWEGEGTSPIFYPSLPPDLFPEQPLVLFAHKSDCLSGRLHIKGTLAGGASYYRMFDLDFQEQSNGAIAQLWGRARIKELTNQLLMGNTEAGVEEVMETALAYHLLSPYTAFIAVSDEVRRDSKDRSVVVQIPVEMPEGVSYTGIYGHPATILSDAKLTQLSNTFIQPSESIVKTHPVKERKREVERVTRGRRALAVQHNFSPFDNKLIQPGVGRPDQSQEDQVKSRKPGIPLESVIESITGQQPPPNVLRRRRQKQGFELKILYGVEWFDPESTTNPFPLSTIRQLIETLIPLEFCRRHCLIPLWHDQDASLLVIAMVKPDDWIAQDELRQILNSKEFMFQRRVITPEDFLHILSDYSDKVSEHHRTPQLHTKTTCSSKPQDTDYLLLEEPDDEMLKQIWTMK